MRRFGRTGLCVALSRHASEFDVLYNNMQYDDSEFRKIAPRHMTIDLLPFQQAGVGWLLDRERRSVGGIMSDHLGMGKTVQMLGLCMEAPYHCSSPSNSEVQVSRTHLEAEAFRMITIIRQLQQIPAVGNCSKITQPGKDLFRLMTEIDASVERKAVDFSAHRTDLEPWLKFAGRYFPNFEKRARIFLESPEAQSLDDISTNELRTLIVMPAALVHQWDSEIRTKVKSDRRLQVCIYHGKQTMNTVSMAQLESCDFVLTTYETVVSAAGSLSTGGASNANFDRSKALPLFQVRWKRIILDEAHVVRNPTTVRWKAVELLDGVKKWAVTATPLHNSILDLQTLMKFTGNAALPIHRGTTAGAANDFVIRDRTLQKSVARALMPAMLRRAPVQQRGGRTEVLVALPEKLETVSRLSFDTAEATIYNDILSRSKSQLANTHKEKLAFHVFAMMTRLRQACLHPCLHNGKSMEVYLCGVCKNQATDVILTKCGHAFCYECLHQKFDEASHLEQAVRVPCPECEHPVSSAVFARRVSAALRIQQLRAKPFTSSTKVDAVLKHVQSTREAHPGDKIVIFSQFTGMLDVMTVGLEKLGFACGRIDGSLTLDARAAVIRQFQNTDTVHVLLASKFAVGVGLNLTAANHVIVTDPWWNPAMEEQAVHRCHRIGQKKTVYVTRFIMNESIEDYCFGVAQKKKKFGDAVLGAVSDAEFASNSSFFNDFQALGFVGKAAGV